MNFLKSLGEWLLSNGGIMIAAISGIFSVFADHKSGRKWTILVIVGVVGGFLWSLASAHYADEQQKHVMDDYSNKVDRFVELQSKETVTQTAGQVDANTRKALNEFLNKILGVKSDVAATASLAQINTLTAAGSAVPASVAAVSPDRRSALTIWVFPHAQSEVDYAVVSHRLQELAATVQPHDIVEKTAHTNSVWYGGGATLDEAKAAALIVTSAGVQITQICPADRVQQQNLIQIGGSAAALRAQLPVLTPAEIQGLSSAKCATGSER